MYMYYFGDRQGQEDMIWKVELDQIMILLSNTI